MITISNGLRAENVARLYCFEGENLKQVKSYLSPILKNTDKVSEIETTNCLEIHLSNIRIPLFDSWLSRKYKYKNDFKNGSITTNNRTEAKECRLELIKKNKQSSQTDSLKLGKSSNIKVHNTSSLSSSKSRFLMSSGKPFSFRVNDQQTFITCYKNSAENYNISISLSNLKGALATSVRLVKEQEVNIGKIVEELNKKDKNIDLQSGVKVDNTRSTQTSDYSIKIY